MIVVIVKNIIECRQKQLEDYRIGTDIKIRTISRVIRVNVFKTIQSCYCRKKPIKYLAKFKLKSYKICTLNPYLHYSELPIKNRSKKTVSIIAKEYKYIALESYIKDLVRPISIRSLAKKVPKLPLLSVEPNSKLKISFEYPSNYAGPFLHCYPYMHLSRFYLVWSVTQQDFCTHPILADAWKYYQEVEAFTGLFQHMILLNSFTYWDTVENELRAEGYHPKGFPLVEFIKWEFLRHSMGISSYSDAERIFQNFRPELLAGAFEKPSHIPAPYHASYYYKWLKPIHFQTFFKKLVEDCVTYKIIIPRIVIADGLIFRTWAGNFTLDQWLNPTDPGASITVHNKKQLGKCYNAIVFYAWCGNRWLPIDMRVITGNANENANFVPVVDDFLKTSPYDWMVFLYDSGASSAKNREFLKSNGLITGITARKNIINEVVLDVDHHRYCFESDIPDGMSLEQFKNLLNHRSQEEAGFSGFTTYHHMKQMNTMGQDAAAIHVLKYLILQLMHALAAYKVNRPDLLMMYSAFSTLG